MRVVFATSPKAGSGKTTAIVAIGTQLRRAGMRVGYARVAGPGAQEDADIVTTALRLSAPAQVINPDAEQLAAALAVDVDVLLLETTAADAIEPALRSALERVGAIQLIVAHYTVDDLSERIVHHVEPTIGLSVLVLINAVPEKGRRQIERVVVPTLRQAGYSVIGVVPQDRILLGMSVGELATVLGAEVLCARDQLSLPVEAVMIAAMSDEGAEDYFRRISRKAVVAGGDRPDIHMPALATDTSCIVLTEGLDPDPTVLKTAEEEGVPLLKVNPGTMPTLEQISNALRDVRFRQPSKVARVVALFAAHLDQTALLEAVCVSSQVVAS